MIRALFLYAGGNAGAALLQLLFLPLYLRYLSVGDFGVQALALSSEQLLIVLTGYAFTNAVGKFYSDSRNTGGDIGIVVGSAAAATIAVSAVAVFLWWVLAPVFAEWILPQRDDALLLVRLMGVSFAGALIFNLCINVWQIEARPQIVALFSVARVFVGFAVGFPLIALFGFGAMGALIGLATGTMLVGIACFVILARQRRLDVKVSVIGDMARYGAGLVPAALGNWALKGGDKIIVTQLAGLEATGIYSLAFMLAAGAAQLTVSPFRQVWIPIVWNVRHSAGEATVHRLAAWLYALIQALALAGLGLLVYLALDLLSNFQPVYREGAVTAVLVYAGYVLAGGADFVALGIFFTGRTFYYSAGMLIGAIVGLGSAFFLVPTMGIAGAGLAFLISNILFLSLTGYWGQKLFSAGFDIRPYGILVVVLLPSIYLFMLLGEVGLRTILIGLATLSALSAGLWLSSHRMLQALRKQYQMAAVRGRVS